MYRYVTIFNKVNSYGEFSYSNKDIAGWSGFDPSKVSRFLNGRTNIPTSDFFKLLDCMPTRFQQCYWEALIGNKDKQWRSLIAKASASEIQEILVAISERWAALNGDQKLDFQSQQEKVPA